MYCLLSLVCKILAGTAGKQQLYLGEETIFHLRGNFLFSDFIQINENSNVFTILYHVLWHIWSLDGYSKQNSDYYTQDVLVENQGFPGYLQEV
jgi:hypothetical protein